jgi:hypothetical protein
MTITLGSYAHAETFSIWVMGKTGVAGSTDNAFSRFDKSTGQGIEAGLELFHVSLFAEAMDMGSNQLLLTGNLGWDTSWGNDWRLNLGFFTGPVLMMFPEAEPSSPTVSAQRDSIEEAGVDTLAVDAQLNNGMLMDEEELAKLSVGWNLVRSRLQFERRLFTGAYLGISFDGAFHMVATGDEVAAGAKHMVLNQMEQQQGIDNVDPRMNEEIRADLGAEALDPGNMGGFNYNVGAYVKFQI